MSICSANRPSLNLGDVTQVEIILFVTLLKGATTLSIMTLIITTVSIMPVSIMPVSITTLKTRHPSQKTLGRTLLVVLLRVIMQNVIVLSVVAPRQVPYYCRHVRFRKKTFANVHSLLNIVFFNDN
jgi:hypothetical protein